MRRSAAARLAVAWDLVLGWLETAPLRLIERRRKSPTIDVGQPWINRRLERRR